MPKFRYTGKEPQNLAQVGEIVPGQVIEVNDAIGASLRQHAHEQFESVDAKTPVGVPGEKADKKQPVAPPPPPPAGDGKSA